MTEDSDRLSKRGEELMERLGHGESLSQEELGELLKAVGDDWGPGNASHLAMERIDLREQLVPLLKHRDISIRRKAAKALHMSFFNHQELDDGLEDQLVDACKNSDSVVRGLVLGILGSGRSEESFQAIKAAMSDEDDYVRSAAARSLGARNDERGLEVLEIAARSPAEKVMISASCALEEVSPGHPIVRQNASKLIAAYQKDKKDLVLAQTLGRIGTAEAMSALYEALDSQDKHERTMALHGFEACKHIPDLTPIFRCLGSDDMSERLQAVMILTEVHPQQIRDWMATLLDR